MFTIEHDFDATVVTLIDEGRQQLTDDITIRAFDDRIVVTQYNTRSDQSQTVTLSISQLDDLLAAMDLPEGIYKRAAVQQLRKGEQR